MLAQQMRYSRHIDTCVRTRLQDWRRRWRRRQVRESRHLCVVISHWWQSLAR